jgi:glycosidase
MSSVDDLLSPVAPDSLKTAREILDQARREKISYFPSPESWQDEVLYFLLPDRFSDDKTDSRPLLSRSEIIGLRSASSRPGWNWQAWANSGKRWQGGTIRGIRQQLDYLADLGITALWIGPILKQRVRLDTYHGYGIQDFLEVDPRFGTRQDLCDLTQAAHERSIRILLDIIINHCGDNWGYLQPGASPPACINEPSYRYWPDYYGNPQGEGSKDWQLAWRSEEQDGFTLDPDSISTRDQGIWPRELQDQARFTRAGKGALDRGAKEDPHAEFRRTDFFALKDFALDVSPTLNFLADCYKYWIAITDIDGYRIDTVKHMDLESARNFAGAIREFAESLGKRNFLLISEIAGGDDYQDFYLDHLSILRRNMTAALDIGGAKTALAAVGKGLCAASNYFNGFYQYDQGFGSHRNDGSRHVSILDDHDHVFGEKVRFSAEIPDDYKVKDYQIVAPTAIQLFSLGIPCIYYGTEQAFAGPAQSQIPFIQGEGWKDGNNSGDRYLREAMFGPEHPRTSHDNPMADQLNSVDQSLPGFGPFGTCGKHCFDQMSPAYVRIAALCRVRKEHVVLRTGRQYQRQIRLPHTWFEFPVAGEIIAWSRVLDTIEALCVANPNATAPRGGDIVVDAEISPPEAEFEVIANTEHAAQGDAYTGMYPVGKILTVVGRSQQNEPAFLPIKDIPPCEVLVLVKKL